MDREIPALAVTGFVSLSLSLRLDPLQFPASYPLNSRPKPPR